jgi:hypothetical protein
MVPSAMYSSSSVDARMEVELLVRDETPRMTDDDDDTDTDNETTVCRCNRLMLLLSRANKTRTVQ